LKEYVASDSLICFSVGFFFTVSPVFHRGDPAERDGQVKAPRPARITTAGATRRLFPNALILSTPSRPRDCLAHERQDFLPIAFGKVRPDGAEISIRWQA